MANSDYVKMSSYVSESLNKINPGIGKYVHLHRGNYERHGITPNSEENGLSSATEAYKASKQQLQGIVANSKNFDSQTIKDLEQFMTAMVYADWNNKNLSFKGYGIGKTRTKHIQDQWCKLAETTVNDMMQLLQNSELKSSDLNKRKQEWQKEQKYSANTQSVTINTINKLLARINNTINTIEGMKGTLSPAEINTLKNQADALIKDIEQLKKTPEYQNARDGITKTVSKGTIIPKTGKSFGQLIEEINLLVNGTTSLAKSIGDSLEYFAAAVTLATKQKIYKKTDDEIKNVLKGSSHDKTKINIGLGYNGTEIDTMINIKYLQDEVKNGTTSNGFKINGAEISYTSQGTVDWEVEDDNPIFKNVSKQLAKGFTASLKNYNNSNSVKMIQGASLLSILNLMNTDFINHYLNLLCHFPERDEHASYQKLIKYGTAVRGLTGARGGASEFKQNDLLIINDKNIKRVRIFDVVTMLKNLENNLDAIDSFVSVKVLPRSFSQEEIKGGSKEIIVSIRKRITKLVAKLHQQKITATLKPSAFKQNLTN